MHVLLWTNELVGVLRKISLNLNVQMGLRLFNHHEVNCRRTALRRIEACGAERHEHEAQRLQILIAEANRVFRQGLINSSFVQEVLYGRAVSKKVCGLDSCTKMELVRVM